MRFIILFHFMQDFILSASRFSSSSSMPDLQVPADGLQFFGSLPVYFLVKGFDLASFSSESLFFLDGNVLHDPGSCGFYFCQFADNIFHRFSSLCLLYIIHLFQKKSIEIFIIFKLIYTKDIIIMVVFLVFFGEFCGNL